jgi:glutamate 5-kinase
MNGTQSWKQQTSLHGMIAGQPLLSSILAMLSALQWLNATSTFNLLAIISVKPVINTKLANSLSVAG